MKKRKRQDLSQYVVNVIKHVDELVFCDLRVHISIARFIPPACSGEFVRYFPPSSEEGERYEVYDKILAVSAESGSIFEQSIRASISKRKKIIRFSPDDHIKMAVAGEVRRRLIYCSAVRLHTPDYISKTDLFGSINDFLCRYTELFKEDNYEYEYDITVIRALTYLRAVARELMDNHLRMIILSSPVRSKGAGGLQIKTSQEKMI